MGTVFSQYCIDVSKEDLSTELNLSINGNEDADSLQQFTLKADARRTIPRLPLSNALPKQLKKYQKSGFIEFIPSNPVAMGGFIIVYLRILMMNEIEDGSEIKDISEETLSAIRRLIEDSEGIYRYNSSSNEWFKVISLSEKEYIMDRNTAVVRPGTSELWIFETAERNPTECVLYKFDLSMNKLIYKDHVVIEPPFEFSLNPSSNFLFFLNDNLYVFVRKEPPYIIGSQSLRLCVFDETHCRFAELMIWPRNSSISFSIPEFIYLPNNQTILRWNKGKGRTEMVNNFATFGTDKLSAIRWKDCDSGGILNHHEFKIGHDTMVSVLDGSYVLIICMRAEEGDTSILVYEVGINRFYKSDVVLPLGPYSGWWRSWSVPVPAVTTEDGIVLVTAYICYCWRLTEFRKLRPFPQSLSMIIANYYGQETLHILYEDEHYCISVADILEEKTYGENDFAFSQIYLED